MDPRNATLPKQSPDCFDNVAFRGYILLSRLLLVVDLYNEIKVNRIL